MKNLTRPFAALLTTLTLLLTLGCSDGSDTFESDAERLFGRFGELQVFFTLAGIQDLLEVEETGQPIVLLQLMSITDSDAFARYDQQSTALWESVGASVRRRITI